MDPGGSLAGIVAIGSNYTQSAAGRLNLQLGGLLPGSQFDKLDIVGGATLGGTLSLSLINGFSPSLGDSFQVLTFGSRTGQFATINGLAIGNPFDPFGCAQGTRSAQGARGTDPHDPASFFRISKIDKSATGTQLQFGTATGNPSTALRTPNLSPRIHRRPAQRVAGVTRYTDAHHDL